MLLAGQTMRAMGETEVVLPKSSLTMTEAVIIEWLVGLGQRVATGDVLLSIETNKASQEIEAPVSGVVTSILKLAGKTVLAGEVICLNAEDSGQSRPLEVSASRSVAPAAAALAQMLGIDVASILGTGPGGRRGLFAKYGPDRVRDTAISEDAIVGAAIGGSACGLRPVAEIMFSSFLGCCWDELINHASQLHYVSNGAISPRLTIRTVNVLGRSSGCHHSGRPEAALMHTPGLAIAVPADPRDVKGLLKASIRSDNPVVFIEHALLYDERCELDQSSPEVVEFGRARTVHIGSDLTILSTPVASGSRSRPHRYCRPRESTPRCLICARSCRSTLTAFSDQYVARNAP
jgi:hypothetical protein